MLHLFLSTWLSVCLQWRIQKCLAARLELGMAETQHGSRRRFWYDPDHLQTPQQPSANSTCRTPPPCERWSLRYHCFPAPIHSQELLVSTSRHPKESLFTSIGGCPFGHCSCRWTVSLSLSLSDGVTLERSLGSDKVDYHDWTRFACLPSVLDFLFLCRFTFGWSGVFASMFLKTAAGIRAVVVDSDAQDGRNLAEKLTDSPDQRGR
jgi:hypothetical protein